MGWRRRSLAARLVDMYDRFTGAARAAVMRAEAEAAERGAPAVEPSDVVIALVGYDGVAGAVLRAIDVSVELLRQGVPTLAEPIARPRPLSLAETTAEAFRLAAREADGMRVSYVATEHLLLGLLREPSAMVATMLVRARRDPGLVRERVLDLLSSAGFVSPEATLASEVVAPPVAPSPVLQPDPVNQPEPAMQGGRSTPRVRLHAQDRALLESLFAEVAQLRDEVARLREDLAGADALQTRQIA